MTPADHLARKQWIQLFAVVTTMLTYFVMTSMAGINVDFTPLCCEQRLMSLTATLMIIFLMFDSHYIPFEERLQILNIVCVFVTLFTCRNISYNTKMIMNVELDTLDYTVRAIELYLHIIGLFFSLLNILHILVNLLTS